MRASKKDIPHVNFTLSQDEVFQYCTDDNFPIEHRWGIGSILLNNDAAYVSIPNPHCVFIALPTSNSGVYEVHVAVSPEGRGVNAVIGARQSIVEFFKDMPTVHKFIGFTPLHLKRAIAFSRMVGFSKEGVSKKSFLKDGKLHDQLISGFMREEVSRWA